MVISVILNILNLIILDQLTVLADNKGDKRSNFVRFLSDKWFQNQ